MVQHHRCRYYKVDIHRAFFSWRFWCGTFGIVLTMIFASLETKQWEKCVINVFWLVTYSMPFLIVFVFAALPYADCLCQDLENKYIVNELIRGSLFKYTLWKAVTIFFSSLAVMALGMTIYAFFLNMRLPWIDLEESTYVNAMTYGGFRGILKAGYYPVYYFMYGLQYGILAGDLSLLAAWVSTFYANRLLVLSVPVAAWYFIQHYEAAIFHNGKFNLARIFDATNNLWNNDLLSFLNAVIIGLLIAVTLTWGIFRRLKRRV